MAGRGEGAPELRIKRVYDPAEPSDGLRVLVDRLWPRGLSRQRAALDLWAKDVAPSPELRRWWQHDPARMEEFANRYRRELEGNPAAEQLRATIEARGEQPPSGTGSGKARAPAADRVTLLYAAHDPQVNHARVLLDWLRTPRG